MIPEPRGATVWPQAKSGTEAMRRAKAAAPRPLQDTDVARRVIPGALFIG
jgi:hypothetical protein